MNQATMHSVSDLTQDSRARGLSDLNGIEAGRIVVPQWVDQNGLQDWLWHGFSTRAGGVSRAYLSEEKQAEAGELNLGFTSADLPANVRENRLRFIETVTGSRTTPLVTVRQVHSNVCAALRAPESGFPSDAIPEADGIITCQPGVLLAIQTADCIPVLVADSKKRVVAGFHAGWRGTVQRIVESGIARMRSEFGCEPEDLVAAIGPGIGICCYTVGVEVLGEFESNFSYASELFRRDEEGASRTSRAWRLDLTEANRHQLLDAGLSATSIATVGGCTACQPDLFYSHRASGGHAGRMMSVIGIR
jgi:polyphenol oxidase